MVTEERLPSIEERNESLKRAIEIFNYPQKTLRSDAVIYYPKKNTSGKYFFDYVPSREQFKADYVWVFTITKAFRATVNKYAKTRKMNILETIFEIFNISNPLATDEGQQAIRFAGASHTSMSVGDIIQIGKTKYIVAGEGFKRIKWK